MRYQQRKINDQSYSRDTHKCQYFPCNYVFPPSTEHVVSGTVQIKYKSAQIA